MGIRKKGISEGEGLDESVSKIKWTVLARLSLTNLAPFPSQR